MVFSCTRLWKAIVNLECISDDLLASLCAVLLFYAWNAILGFFCISIPLHPSVLISGSPSSKKSNFWSPITHYKIIFYNSTEFTVLISTLLSFISISAMGRPVGQHFL